MGEEDLRSKHATKLTADEFVDLITRDGVQALDRIIADLGYVKRDKPARGWFPNRRQWCVIWIGLLLGVCAWLYDVLTEGVYSLTHWQHWHLQRALEKRRAEVAIAALAVAGLLVWALSRAKGVRKS